MSIDLASLERSLLTQGVLQWLGPARTTTAFARALGFRDVPHLVEEATNLHDSLRAERALTRVEWTQALLLTELAWSSDEVGAATDWDAVTDFTDEDTLPVLRRVQRALRHTVDANLLQP